MAKATTIARPQTAASGFPTRAALAGAALFVVLLAALHVINPGLDPSWHFISEYALGAHGWLMNLAFFSLALSCAALFLAVRSHIQTVAGRIGLILLLVNAAGLLMGGIFPTDPINTSPEAMTPTGMLHNVGGTLGMAMPFAIALITWSLSRREDWSPARRSLIAFAGLAWVGFLVSFISIGVMVSQSGGVFGPGVSVGWPNRFEILAYSVWLLVTAWHAAQLNRQSA